MAQNRELGELGQYLTVDTSVNSIYMNAVSVSAGNSTVNTTINSTGIFIGNSSSNSVILLNNAYISLYPSFRNKIINGNFDIWQRTTSTSTQGYNADRWITNVTGSTFTSSRQSFTLGQTSVPYEPTYWHRTVVTSSAGASNGVVVRQPIESVRTLAGQTATLSFWAKADASKNIAVEFSQIFGTGGSPSSTVTGIGVTTCALTTSWTKYTVTVNISSISGKTLGSNNDDYLELRFWFDAGSSFNSRTNSLGQQSGTFDIAQVQLEAGSVATPFEIINKEIILSLCKRYYQYYASLVAGGWGNSTTEYFSYFYSTEMRIVPTGSILNDTYSSASSTAINQTKIDLVRIQMTITAGGGYGFSVFDIKLDAEY